MLSHHNQERKACIVSKAKEKILRTTFTSLFGEGSYEVYLSGSDSSASSSQHSNRNNRQSKPN